MDPFRGGMVLASYKLGLGTISQWCDVRQTTISSLNLIH